MVHSRIPTTAISKLSDEKLLDLHRRITLADIPYIGWDDPEVTDGIPGESPGTGRLWGGVDNNQLDQTSLNNLLQNRGLSVGAANAFNERFEVAATVVVKSGN